MQEVSICLFIY